MIVKRVCVGKYTFVQRVECIRRKPLAFAAMDDFAAPGGMSMTMDEIQRFAKANQLKMEVMEYEQ